MFEFNLFKLNHFRLIACSIVILVLISYYFFCKYKPELSKLWRKILLGIFIFLAFFAITLYTDFWRTGLMTWDYYHYYFGAKYYDELGYNNLYHCTLVADSEGHKFFKRIKKVRDLTTYEIVTVKSVVKNPEPCHSRFSEERWYLFKKDLESMQKLAPSLSSWEKYLVDKGYNATPAWTFYGRLITNSFGLENNWGISFSICLDIILMIILFAFIAYTFGWQIMLLCLIIFGLNALAMFKNLGGSLLRLDWVFGLGMGICCLKQKKYSLAGIFLALSGMARVFPIIFSLIIFIKGIYLSLQQKTILKPYFHFILTFSFTVLVLFILGSSFGEGVRNWLNFADKIQTHDQGFAGRRVGFRYFYSSLPAIDLFPPNINDRAMIKKFSIIQIIPGHFNFYSLNYSLFILLFLSLFIFLVFRKKDYQAVILSIFLVYFLVAPTDYYYVILLFLPIYFSDLKKKSHLFGLIYIFLSFIAVYLTENKFPAKFARTYAFTFLMFFYCLYILILLALEKGKILKKIILNRF